MNRKSPFLVKNIKRIIKIYLINSKKVISSLIVFALILASLISMVAPAAGFTVDEGNNILQPIADEEQPESNLLNDFNDEQVNINTALDTSISERGSKDDQASIFPGPDDKNTLLNFFNFKDNDIRNYFRDRNKPDNSAKKIPLNPFNFEYDNEKYVKNRNRHDNTEKNNNGELLIDDVKAWEKQREIKDREFAEEENSADRYSLDELCGLVEPENWWVDARFDPCIPRGDLPDTFDWRTLGGCTPIKTQGGCGSCWAFGTVAPLECNIKIKDGVEEDLSEQWLVSCNQEGWGCNGGWWAHMIIISGRPIAVAGLGLF